MYNALYNATDVARYILGYCKSNNKQISNLQLQKIMFFVQKEYYSKTGEWLISDDFEAWRLGPVIPSVYYKYCIFGASPIRSREPAYDLPPFVSAIIDPVIFHKSRLSPWELVEQSHASGGAWDTIFCNGYGNKQIIPKSEIANRG